MKRFEKLLSDVAGQFENGASPMNHDWLVENNVNINECHDLMEKIALVLKGYLNSTKERRTKIEIAGASEDAEQAEMLVSALEHAQTTKRIRNL